MKTTGFAIKEGIYLSLEELKIAKAKAVSDRFFFESKCTAEEALALQVSARNEVDVAYSRVILLQNAQQEYNSKVLVHELTLAHHIKDKGRIETQKAILNSCMNGGYSNTTKVAGIEETSKRVLTTDAYKAAFRVVVKAEYLIKQRIATGNSRYITVADNVIDVLKALGITSIQE